MTTDGIEQVPDPTKLVTPGIRKNVFTTERGSFFDTPPTRPEVTRPRSEKVSPSTTITRVIRYEVTTFEVSTPSTDLVSNTRV